MKDELQISFDEQKTINALLYIVSKLKRADFHKIFKILYFADREHLTKYGRAISGDNYIAMDDGPVPSNLYDIFKSVRGDSYFKDNGKFSSRFSVVDWNLIKANADYNLKFLSKTDLQEINDSLEKYGHLSWDEVREKSHDYAWRNTAINSRISFENMVLEAGEDDVFIDYLREKTSLQNLGD